MSAAVTDDPQESYYSYWSHPESDCVVAIPKNEVTDNLDPFLVELELDQYLSMVSSASELPVDVTGIIKNAIRAPFSNDVIYGELWFDRKGRFPNGYSINTSRIVDVRSDGVHCTMHSKYLVQWAPGTVIRNGKSVSAVIPAAPEAE